MNRIFGYLKKIKAFVRNIVPKDLYLYIGRMFHYLFDLRDFASKKQHVYSFGELNPDKTFMIIRFYKGNQFYGFYCIWNIVVCWIMYALKKGWIPVVDFKCERVISWQNKEHEKKENAWEYFYKPLFPKYSLDEVYHSKRVVIPSRRIFIPGMFVFPFEKDKLTLRKFDIVHKYIHPNTRMLAEINRWHEKLGFEGKRILGVSVRKGYGFEAANYDVMKFDIGYHPAQAENEEYFSNIDKYMKLWKCDYIYLAVDDYETSLLYKERYGDKCLSMERIRAIYTKDAKFVSLKGKLRDDFDVAKSADALGSEYTQYTGAQGEQTTEHVNSEYMVEMILLSKCNSLICSNNNGTIAAILMNAGKYEHVKVLDNGYIKDVSKDRFQRASQ